MTRRMVIGELSHAYSTIQSNTRHHRTHSPVSSGLRPGARHLGQVLEGRYESPVDMEGAPFTRPFRDVEEDLSEFVLSGLAKLIACRHSGPRLDSFS